jgi:Tol biopolymer transport system component
MIRRAALPLIIALGLVLSAHSSAAISVDGPQLAFSRLKAHFPANLDSLSDFRKLRLKGDLVTSGPLGDLEQRLLRTSLPGHRFLRGGPAWSPDGSALALTLVTHTDVGETTDIYVINRDGTGLRSVTEFGDADDPVFSSDGRTLYFSRSASELRSTIWTIGIDGALPHQAGLSLPGTNAPTSISPASGDIALSRTACTFHVSFPPLDRCRSSIELLTPASGAVTRLAKGAIDATFSPDGAQIAFISRGDQVTGLYKDKKPVGDLYILDLATRQRLRLTRTKHAAEGAPSWDPSGQRIAFVRNKGRSSRLVEINADGTCETALPKGPSHHQVVFAYDSPTWQPGPGREAGRIAC